MTNPLPSPDSPSSNDDLCTAYLNELPVDGAAISIFVGTGNETRITATDDVAVALDETQFTVGEGPRWDAVRTRLPVTVPDTGAAHLLWPALGAGLADTGAAALVVLPLMVGAVDVGVIELYHHKPRRLSPAQLAHARGLATRTSLTLLHLILDRQRHSELEFSPGGEPLERREVHQATGMILVQADVSAADALLLLRAHAFAQGISLKDAAQAVVTRRITFTPDENSGFETSSTPPNGPGPDPGRGSVSDHAGREED